MQYRLTETTPLSHDVTRLTLTPVSGGRQTFSPGQYLEIVLAPDIRCAYSIACAPRTDGSLELHVRAIPHSDNYRVLAKQLALNALFDIELPFGDIRMNASGGMAGETSSGADPLVLLAGSTGFSQAKALIEGWVHAHCPRPLRVYWGGRSAADLYQHQWMNELTGQFPGLRYIPVVSDDTQHWSGRTGFVHQAVLADLNDLNNFRDVTIIGCGSPPMVYAAYDDFTAAGMQAGQFLSDVFAYAPR